MAKRKRTDLSEVVCHFESLEDPRSSVNRLHPLTSVVVISLMAVLCGADGPTAIRKWAEAKREMLLGALSLPNGLPSKDVFRHAQARPRMCRLGRPAATRFRRARIEMMARR